MIRKLNRREKSNVWERAGSRAAAAVSMVGCGLTNKGICTDLRLYIILIEGLTRSIKMINALQLPVVHYTICFDSWYMIEARQLINTKEAGS